MAGFWHLSHHQMRDPNGAVYDGATAYFYAADSLLPITVYQDYGLGTAHPNPVSANGYGIFPPVFLDETDGFYRQIVRTKSGVKIPGTDVGTLPIIGPGEGGGGSEVPVDPNALLQTGFPLWIPATGNLAGFVRMNGRTIGAATSGAAERANADCESLFIYNWTTYTDSYCAVSGGRGVSAAADWAANKTITLLDMRNRSPFGVADMGNSSTTGFASVTFTRGDATTVGALTGASRKTLALTEIPSHEHTITDPGHTHGIPGNTVSTSPFVNYSTNGIASLQQSSSATTGITKANAAGGGQAFDTLPPLMLGTFYQKL